ncbi:MAG TPA: hypothetical protein VFS31_02620, partial [Chitinophagaceae bacterium]|nr:hypothetical protein [Chitinophagaceae bacterium]
TIRRHTLISTAIIWEAMPAQYPPPMNEISANTSCFHSFQSCSVSTNSAAPARCTEHDRKGRFGEVTSKGNTDHVDCQGTSHG